MGKDELIVIVPAAGAGKRLGLGINKAFAMLNGAPLLVHCLHMLEATGLLSVPLSCWRRRRLLKAVSFWQAIRKIISGRCRFA